MEAQAQATPAAAADAAPAAAPTSEQAPAAQPQVTDGSSYAALVKSRFLEAQAAAAEPAPDPGKARDDQGRFKPRLVETPAETPAEQGDEQAETPEVESAAPEAPAEPPSKQEKLAELARRVEAERTKRRAEAERKAAQDEFTRAQPIVRGLQTDKVKTVDDLMSDAEFEALCDRRIARLNGQQQPSAEAQAEAQKVRAEVEEARRTASEARGMIAKLSFQKQVDRIAPKSEGYEVSRDWCEAKGQSFAEVCADVTETVFNRDKYWMSPEQARDTVIAFVLTELQTAESVSGKRSPAPAAAPTSQPVEKPKRKTLNSTLQGSSSRSPDVRITGKESYAEHIKAKLRAGK